ncbi:MAG: 6-phosphogluconolactonase, partial [Elusimicrobiota bacterium]
DLYLSRAAAIRRLDERLRQAGGSAPPPEAERLSGAALAETFERFYAAARRRDTILADNLLREMDGRDSAGGPAAVVVAGGFHAPGLQARLRDGGCNVLVLAPRLSKVDSAHYMAAFTRERTPLDKVLLGEKLFLVYPLVLGSKRVLKKYEADVRKLDTFFPAVASALAVKSLGSVEEAAVRRTLAAMLARLEASGLSSSIEDIQPSDDPKALLVTVQTPATSEAPARRRTLTFLVGPDIEKSIKRLSRRYRLVDRGQEFAVLATTGEPWSWKSLGRRLPPIPALPLFLSAVHMISTGLQNPWALPLSVLLAGELIRRTAGLYSLPLPMNGSLQDVSPRIIIADDADGLGERTAEKMADLIERNNRTPGKATVLGLATGGTVVPVYKAFVRLAKERNLDLSRVHTFNLDEYAGLPPEHAQSYRYFMDKHLFSLVGIPPQNIHFLNGMVDRRDPRAVQEECARFEKEIRGLGGIDLQLLGIGPKRDVHIGFNHKGTPLGSRTHVVKLPRAVRRANSRFFGDDISQVPTHALTMGISTILDAREIILAANGAHKALSVRKALFNRMGSRTPASFLRLHPKVLFILDRAAAGLPGAGSGESESWWHRSRLNPATAAGTRVQRGLNLTVGLVYSLSIVAAQVLSGQIMGDLQIAAANALLGTAIMVRHRYTRAAVIDMAVLFMAFNLITAFVMRNGALAIAAGVGTIVLSMAVGSPQLSVEHPNLRKILGRFNGHNGRARSGNGSAAMRGLGSLLKRINPAADDSIRFYRRLTMVAPYALIIGFELASWLLKMDPVGLAIAQGVASIGLGLAVRSRFARGLAMFTSAQLMIKDMAFIAAGMDPGLYLLAMAPAWIGWNMAQNAPGWGNGPLKFESWLTSRWRGKRRESPHVDVVSKLDGPASQTPTGPSAAAGSQARGMVEMDVRPEGPGVSPAGRPASAMEHPLLQEAHGRNGDDWRTRVRGAGWNFASIQALKFYRPFSFFFSLAFVSYGLIQAALGVQPVFMAIAAGGGLVALSIGTLYIYRPGYRRAALYTETAAVLFSLAITLMQGDPKVFLNAFPGALVAVSILAGYVPLKAPEEASGAKRLIRKAEEAFFKALPLAAGLASVAGLAFFPLALLGILDLSTAALTAVSSLAANMAIANSNMALNLTRRKYGPFNPFRFRAGPAEEPAGGRPEASAPAPSAAPAIRAEQASAADAERAPPTASRQAFGRSALLFFVSAGFAFGFPVLSGLLHTAGIRFPLAGFIPNQPISLLLGLAASAGFMLIDNKGVPLFPEGIRYLRQDLFTRRSRPLFEVKHDIKDPGAIFDGEKTHIFTSLGSIQNERWKIAHITSKTTHPGAEAPESPDKEWNDPEDVDLVWEPLKAVLRKEEYQALMAGRGYAMAAPGMYYEEIGEGELKRGVFHMYLQTDSFILGGIIFHLTSTDGGKTFVAQDIVARASNIPGRPFAGMYDPEPFEDDNGEKYLILSGMDQVKKPEIYLLKSESKTWSGPWTPVSEKPLFGFDHPDVQGLVNQPEDSAFEWGFEGAQIFKFKVDGQTKYGLLGAMFFKSGDSGTRQRLFFAVADKVDGPYQLAGPIIDPSAPDAGDWERDGENGHGSIHYRKDADGKGKYYLFYQARAPGKDWRNGLAIFEEDPLADCLANFLPSSRNAAPVGLGSQTNQTAADGTDLKTDQNLEQPGIERRPAVSPGGVVQHFNIVRAVKKHGLPWGLFWVSSHTIAPAFLFHLNPFLGGLAAAILWGEFVIGFHFRKWRQNRRQAGLAAAPPAAERSGRDYFPAQAEETRRMWERLFRDSYATRSAGQEAAFTAVYESARYWGPWTAAAVLPIHFFALAPGFAWGLMAAAALGSFLYFRRADPTAPVEVSLGLTLLYSCSAGLAAVLGNPWLLALMPAGWAGHGFHDKPLLAVRRISKPFDLRSRLSERYEKYGEAVLEGFYEEKRPEDLEAVVIGWMRGSQRHPDQEDFLMNRLEKWRPDIDEVVRERIVTLHINYIDAVKHFRRVVEDGREKAPGEMVAALSRLKELKKLTEFYQLSGDLGMPPGLDEFYDLLLLESLSIPDNLFADEAKNLAAAVSYLPALQDKAEEWLKAYIVPDEPYHGTPSFQRDDGTWEEFEYWRSEYQNGRSQGGTRYEYDGNGKTFLKVLGLSLAMRVKHPLMGNHFDGGKSGLVFQGPRGSYSDAELERAGRAFMRDLFKRIQDRRGPSYVWQGGIAPDMGTSPDDMALYSDEFFRIFLEQW